MFRRAKFQYIAGLVPRSAGGADLVGKGGGHQGKSVASLPLGGFLIFQFSSYADRTHLLRMPSCQQTSRYFSRLDAAQDVADLE
jgi:hypothetical protein